MTPELSAEVREKINAHLDAVENVLIHCGRTREQRRAVIDDLELQILDMLAARNAKPTPADMQAVLSQIDPPDHYADERPAPIQSSPIAPHHSLAATLSFVIFCIIAGLAMLGLISAAIGFSPSRAAESWLNAAGYLGLLVLLAGVILGSLGARKKNANRNLALIGLICNGAILLLAFFWLLSTSGPARPPTPPPQRASASHAPPTPNANNANGQ